MYSSDLHGMTPETPQHLLDLQHLDVMCQSFVCSFGHFSKTTESMSDSIR